MKRIAADIGGTFTDITYIDEDAMEFKVDKVETTPKNLVEGVLQAIKKIKVDMPEVTSFNHGTTVAMNALIQKKGAKTGLITTKGFRDILEIRRANRPDADMYNILFKKPEILVPRYLRLEVTERTRYNGEIIKKLNEKEVEEAARKLKESGVESIAVCLLHSFANPEHEEKIEKIIKKIWPEVFISLSHRVVRELREYERTSTVVLDAYIKKVVVSYLSQLEFKLKEDLRFPKEPLIASSTGGVLTVPIAKEKPILTVSSGPVGGAIGAAYLGEVLGIKNLLTADVGGTSYDVSLIIDGKNKLRTEMELLGYPVLVSSIDTRSIGAGGGSIAYVDRAGILHVGPRSAGAVPGPMCYGKGGDEPTVTDAAVVNGLINPDYFLGGEMKLDVNLAEKGVENIAEKLRTTINEAAEGILAVAKNNMANMVQEILVGEGYDPRDFTMISYGGAGGIFAGDIAKAMDIRQVIIPRFPAVFCAWGMLQADMVHTFSQTYISSTDDLDVQKVNGIFSGMENSAVRLLKEAGIPEERMIFIRSVDMRYEGQRGRGVEVSLPSGRLGEDIKAEMNKAFDEVHEAIHGHKMESPRETVNFRLRAIGKLKKAPTREIPKGDKIPPENALKPGRKVYFAGDFVECNIYERDKLLYGNTIEGPAILEEPAHTTVVMPGQTLYVDKYGNLVIKIGGRV